MPDKGKVFFIEAKRSHVNQESRTLQILNFNLHKIYELSRFQSMNKALNMISYPLRLFSDVISKKYFDCIKIRLTPLIFIFTNKLIILGRI